MALLVADAFGLCECDGALEDVQGGAGVAARERDEVVEGIVGERDPALRSEAPGESSLLVGQRTTVLRLGDTGPQVAAIQRVLRVRVTGVFDERTRAAVKEAQAMAGLASTGVVASRTWSLFDRLTA